MYGHPCLGRHSDEGLGVRGVLRADDQDDVARCGQVTHRLLTVGRRVAEVAPSGHPEGRLGEQSHAALVGGGERPETIVRVDKRHRGWRFCDDADRFVVAVVADVDDVESTIGHVANLMMHLGDERADGIDHDRRPVVGHLDDIGRRTVGGQHHR